MTSWVKIIEKKRDDQELSTQDIELFVQGVCSQDMPDYAIASMLMAIYIRGLSERETLDLTRFMMLSGEVLDFGQRQVVDKHSTGGVGDKATFVLAPLVQACGASVAMMAGRGLGHTGGTIDKIQAIPGIRTDLDPEQFISQVCETGLALCGQSEHLAPADRKLYALRDVTATVPSIGLITSSIMSKKLAEGAKALVFDIKVGQGAFMKDLGQAKQLAKSMETVAHEFGRETSFFFTDMNQPLGQCVGHSLEIIESLETLQGNGPKDLTELSLTLAAEMVFLARCAKNRVEARERVEQALSSGQALKSFEDFIHMQGGDLKKFYDQGPKLAQNSKDLLASKNGSLAKIDARQLGLACLELGGGRKKVTDQIDLGVGIKLHQKVGDSLKQGEPLLTLYFNEGQGPLVDEILQNLESHAISIEERPVETPQLILDQILDKGPKES